MSRTYLRGEIYYADLDPVVGSEQMGTRPVLILQNNVGNHFARTVIVAPITSRIHTKSKIPTHSYIGIIGRMKYPSVVMLEQLRTLDKRRIGYYIGKLPEEKMQDVTRALCVSLAIRQNTAKGMLTAMEKLFTRKEAAELLGISITTLDAARNNGLIAYVQYVPNGCVFFTSASLQEYVAKCTHRAKPMEKKTTYRNVRKDHRHD